MFNIVLKVLTLVSLQLNIMVSNINQKIRFEPLNWWIGMKTSSIQLLLYYENISASSVSIDYNGVKLKQTEKTENSNYLFLDVEISAEAVPGCVPIKVLFNDGRKELIEFPLLERTKNFNCQKGFSSSDSIYLIVPDRFAKGNKGVNNLKGYLDKVNRKNAHSRHGGDIQGIINNIDYISELGFTALNICPLLENNMQHNSYHGYAITDFYHIDPRLGSNDDYAKLVKECHKRNMKVIMDTVLNHTGSNHWWFHDFPTQDWYSISDQYINTNFRASTLSDPYASEFDTNVFKYGWFCKEMPKLNQKNRLLAKYLIQNSIWWIETAGIDGIRLDTHPYSDKQFLIDWMTSIKTEYPNFTVVGEVWFEHEAFTASFQKNSRFNQENKSEITCVTDFPLCFALKDAVMQKESWSTGLNRIYHVLAQDFLYPNPLNNLIFLDNHDLPRIAAHIHSDLKKYKMLLSMLVTLRGIPQFYYGTEVLLSGNKELGDGHIRKDMPGGWDDDVTNAFTRENLSEDQLEALLFTQTLFNWRKNNQVIAEGKLKQFLPYNGLFVYVRYNQSGTILVIVNNETSKTKFDSTRYAEILNNEKTGYEIVNKEMIDFDSLYIEGKTALIVEII
jgi:glycosidase